MSIRLTETSKALASITDESLFELLATAVLRESDPIYTGLIHTGINFEGRTVKSPLDGICFVEEDNTKHLVTAHHTITSAKSLKKKMVTGAINGKAPKKHLLESPAWGCC